MAKRKMNKNSLKNLKPNTFNNCEIAKKAQKKSVEKRKENIKRENSKDWAWDKYGTELIEDIVKNGSTKDKVELVKTLFPNDKQINELAGSLSVKKIFITQEEKEATDKHIDDVINYGQDEEYQIKSLSPLKQWNTED